VGGTHRRDRTKIRLRRNPRRLRRGGCQPCNRSPNAESPHTTRCQQPAGLGCLFLCFARSPLFLQSLCRADFTHRRSGLSLSCSQSGHPWRFGTTAIQSATISPHPAAIVFREPRRCSFSFSATRLDAGAFCRSSNRSIRQSPLQFVVSSSSCSLIFKSPNYSSAE
jgi:hypothetical protein